MPSTHPSKPFMTVLRTYGTSKLMLSRRQILLFACLAELQPLWEHQSPRGCCAGLLQADAIASLAELHGDVGEQLAGLAAQYSELRTRLAEAEAAEKKLNALAQLQQRLADFDILLSRGAHSKPVAPALLHRIQSWRLYPLLRMML